MGRASSSSDASAAKQQRVRAWFAQARDALVSVFFPSGCRICNNLLTTASRVPLCEECLSSFGRVAGTLCEICGRPLPGWKQEPEPPLFCPACQDRTYAFDRARSFALYENAIVRAILLLKFEQIEPLGAWFADRLVEAVTAKQIGRRRTWLCRYPFIRNGNESGGITRQRSSPSRWRNGCNCRIEPCCWCARGHVRTNKS